MSSVDKPHDIDKGSCASTPTPLFFSLFRDSLSTVSVKYHAIFFWFLVVAAIICVQEKKSPLQTISLVRSDMTNLRVCTFVRACLCVYVCACVCVCVFVCVCVQVWI